MNINLEALKSLLSSDEFWLDNTQYLDRVYEIISNKILTYYSKKGSMPTPSFMLKSCGNWSEDTDTVAKIRSVLETLVGNYDTELSREEVKELLVDDYKQRQLIPLIKDISKDVARGSFEELSSKFTKAGSILETGLEVNDEVDSRVLLQQTHNKVEMVSTGILDGYDLPVSSIPRGSLIFLLAYSKVGKSLLMLQSMMSSFYAGQSVYLASYELPLSQLRARIMSNVCGVPLSEIQKGEYLIKESELKVRAFPYTLEYDIGISKAYELVKDGKEEEIKAMPKRKNKILIRASMTKSELDAMGESFKSLPNEVELISEIRNRAKLGILDWFYVDYISIIPQSDNSEGREGFITRVSKSFKQLCLEYSVNGMVLSQVVSKFNPFVPKYSRSAGQDADMLLSLANTPESMAEDKVFLAEVLSRHSRGGSVYECMRNYTTQGIEYAGEIGELDDLEEALAKLGKKREVNS